MSQSKDGSFQDFPDELTYKDKIYELYSAGLQPV